MPLPRRQVIHVWLEIFDDTALISGRKVLPGMRELHRPHGAIMSLQDSLEVERQAIP